MIMLLLFPIGKGHDPSLEQICVKFGWNWIGGSGEDKNLKSLDRWMERQWQKTNRKAHLNWAKNWKNYTSTFLEIKMQLANKIRQWMDLELGPSGRNTFQYVWRGWVVLTMPSDLDSENVTYQ